MAWVNTMVEQLEEVYSGSPWHGKSVKSILKEIIPERAGLTVDSSSHSVYQIARHMLSWRKYVIEKLKGNDAYKIAMNSDEDWCKPTVSSEQWAAFLVEFEENQQELVHLIENTTEKVLRKQVGETSYNYKNLIEGIIFHDIYHSGQIVTTAKLTKAYRPSV